MGVLFPKNWVAVDGHNSTATECCLLFCAFPHPHDCSCCCCCGFFPLVFLPVFSKGAVNFTCRAQISSPFPSLILALLLVSRKGRAPEFLSAWPWTLLRPPLPPRFCLLADNMFGWSLAVPTQLLATVRWAAPQHYTPCPSSPQESKGERLGVQHLTALP